jgi:hypothetical protein
MSQRRRTARHRLRSSFVTVSFVIVSIFGSPAANAVKKCSWPVSSLCDQNYRIESCGGDFVHEIVLQDKRSGAVTVFNTEDGTQGVFGKYAITYGSSKMTYRLRTGKIIAREPLQNCS